MNKIKTRNNLVLIHLWLAGLLAPAFVVMALTGGLELLGVETQTSETELVMPMGTQIDTQSETLEEDIGAVLKANELPANFESLRVRPDRITTRPTSSAFVRFTRQEGEWTAVLMEPNWQYSLMELHKGHGPQWFRIYEIISAIALLFVVFGGLAVGIITKPYRRKTWVASGAGTALFVLLAFVI